MRSITCILFTMMFNTPLAAQASEIEELLAGQGFAKVKLVKIATGHDVVRAVINGVAGRFVLDTGAGKTVLNEARKKEYGITEGMIRSETGAGAGGEFQVRYYPAKSVVLGQMNMELTEVATADLDNVVGALGRAAGFRIDGIIGQDALANADAILDVDGETLYLKKWSGDSDAKTKLQERWQRLEEWLVKQNYQKLSLRRLSTGHTTVQVEINGQAGDFVLDSGARASFLHSARLQKYGLGNNQRVGGSTAGGGAGGQLVARDYQLDSFAISGITIPLPQIGSFDLSAVVNYLENRSDSSIDGVIGQDVLVNRRAIIDVSANRLYLLSSAP